MLDKRKMIEALDRATDQVAVVLKIVKLSARLRDQVCQGQQYLLDALVDLQSSS